MFFKQLQGLSLRRHQLESLATPSSRFSPKTPLLVPLFERTDSQAQLIAFPGTLVERGELLARSGAGFAYAAPCAGQVLELLEVEHPMRTARCYARIQPAHLDPAPIFRRLNAAKAGREEILERAREAGIIDEWDGQPLYQKLERAALQGCRILAAGAVDDQPFVSSALALLIESGEEVAAGAVLAATAIGAGRSCIAAVRPPELKNRIPLDIGGVPVVELQGRYPLIPILEGHLRAWGGGVTVGAGACAALARAVSMRAPQCECMVTVAGNLIEHPSNFRVPIGTASGELLRACGLKKSDAQLVMGGAMRGFEIGPDTPVLPESRVLLALERMDAEADGRCLGCGKCIQVCPSGLFPVLIARAAQRSNRKALQRLNAEHCIGCGCCSFVCPARFDVGMWTRKAAVSLSTDNVSHI